MRNWKETLVMTLMIVAFTAPVMFAMGALALETQRMWDALGVAMEAIYGS